MDKLQRYRQIIRTILTEQAQPDNHADEVEPTIICDTKGDHYQLAYIGWEGPKHKQRRVFGILLHFDIKDGKIWIQYNGTELSIAQRLTDEGVPPTDIVIGFHSEFKRQFNGYAVA